MAKLSLDMILFETQTQMQQEKELQKCSTDWTKLELKNPGPTEFNLYCIFAVSFPVESFYYYFRPVDQETCTEVAITFQLLIWVKTENV